MNFRTVVEKATVSLKKRGGQGVLVGNDHLREQGQGYILTAAHCLEFTCEGGMVLGDHFVEMIETNEGILMVSPHAIEPISDVAILGPVDDQAHPWAEEFESFCENTAAVPLCFQEAEPGKPFTVYAYTHKKAWVRGNAKIFDADSPMLGIRFSEQIEGGSSGGPILNEAGELVSIISNTGGPVSTDENGLVMPLTEYCEGLMPRLHLTIPVWLARTFEG